MSIISQLFLLDSPTVDEVKLKNYCGVTGFQGSTTRMAGRRQSMTAQISRQARRLSAVIVPQFTKIEPVNILQKVEGVEIRLNDMAQYRRAVDQYIMRNSVTFDPVEFNVLDPGGYRIMQASLYPEGLHVYEGKRKVCEVSLANDEDSPNCIAKLKHPVTSMTVYELRDMGGTICIQSNCDEIHSTRIVPDRPTCMSLLFACGCAFSKEKWLVLEQDTTRAIIAPVSSFFEENSIKIEWATCSDNEVRLIAVSFGLAQMVRVAFPSLLHILKEFRSRRG